MNLGDRKMQISSEAVPAIRTSPISRVPPAASASATTSSPTPREPLTSRTSPGRDQLAGQRRRLARVGDRVALAVEAVEHLRGARPDGHQHVDPGRRGVGADVAVVVVLGRPELEHVAEHGDAPAGGLVVREVVECGAHRERVGVVAVVDDRGAHSEQHALAAQAGEAHVHAAARRDADRPRGGHRRERVHQVVGLVERQLELDPLAAGEDHLRRAAPRRAPRRRAASCPRRRRRRPARSVTTVSDSRSHGSSSGSSDGTTAVAPS